MNFKELTENNNKAQIKIKEFESKWFIYKNSKDSIWETFHLKGWNESLITKNYANAKQAFSDCAKADIYYFDLFKNNVSTDLFSFGRIHALVTALSDNQDAIKNYSKIDYEIPFRGKKKVKFSELVLKGEGHIYCDIIIKAMNKDLEGVSKDIEIIKNKCLPKKKNQWMETDLRFFESIINKDKDSAFEIINILATKDHKKRNKDSWIYKDLISQPALGFAKILWINEIELEFNNKFLINELLPVKPNNDYKDNIGLLINNMTLKSEDETHNGRKLSVEEYNKRY